MYELDTHILITGGSGFIGGALTNRILQSSVYNVTIYDNLSRGTKDNISAGFGMSNFSFVCADMLDMSSLTKVVNNSDIVFHLAGNPIGSIGSTDTKIDYEQNL